MVEFRKIGNNLNQIQIFKKKKIVDRKRSTCYNVILLLAIFTISLIAVNTNFTKALDTAFCYHYDDESPETGAYLYDNGGGDEQHLGVRFNPITDDLLVTGIRFKYKSYLAGGSDHNVYIEVEGDSSSNVKSYSITGLPNSVDYQWADYHFLSTYYLHDDDPEVRFIGTTTQIEGIIVGLDTPSYGYSIYNIGSGWENMEDYELIIQLKYEPISPLPFVSSVASSSLSKNQFIDAYKVYLNADENYLFPFEYTSGSSAVKLRLIPYSELPSSTLAEWRSDEDPYPMSYYSSSTQTCLLLVEFVNRATATSIDYELFHRAGYQLEAPILSSPNNGEELDDPTPTLSWNGVTGATDYQIQIDDYDSFNSPFIDDTTIDTQYTSSSLGEDTYYWRVRAKDDYNTWGLWSDIWEFSIDTGLAAPILTSPSDTSEIHYYTTTFQWNSVTGATEYQIQIDDYDNFNSPNFDKSTTETEYTPAQLADDTYYWRVRAKNEFDVWGTWSEIWECTIDTAPILSSPSDSSEIADDTPTLSWNSVAGSIEYRIQIDDYDSFSSPIIDDTTIDTEYTPSSLADDTYYWHVRAKNELGSWGSWSETWECTIDTYIPPNDANSGEDAGDSWSTATSIDEGDYSGKLSDDSDWDYYKFYVEASYEISITVSCTQGTENMRLYLYDPDGNKFLTYYFDDEGQLTETTDESGYWCFAIHCTESDEISYSFTMAFDFVPMEPEGFFTAISGGLENWWWFVIGFGILLIVPLATWVIIKIIKKPDPSKDSPSEIKPSKPKKQKKRKVKLSKSSKKELAVDPKVKQESRALAEEAKNWFDQGKTVLAEIKLERAMELDPSNQEALALLRSIKGPTWQPDTIITTSTTIEPKNGDDIEEARESIQKDGTDDDLKEPSQETYEEKKKQITKERLENYEKEIKRGTCSGFIRESLEGILEEYPNNKKAKSLLRKLKKIIQKEVKSLLQKAEQELAKARSIRDKIVKNYMYKKTIEICEEILKLDPQNEIAKRMMAEIGEESPESIADIAQTREIYRMMQKRKKNR
ncbi:MAG: hypothetical protein GF308_21515 [Candidatus Heimdallarchaeota archaeon]|nr:hypothetical protein [Candidatus Heimdallarchaeota archaeon]